MEEHCREHADMYHMVRDIHAALIGNEEKAGIYERIRSLEILKKYVVGLTVVVLGYVGQVIYSYIVSGLAK